MWKPVGCDGGEPAMNARLAARHTRRPRRTRRRPRRRERTCDRAPDERGHHLHLARRHVEEHAHGSPERLADRASRPDRRRRHRPRRLHARRDERHRRVRVHHPGLLPGGRRADRAHRPRRARGHRDGVARHPHGHLGRARRRSAQRRNVMATGSSCPICAGTAKATGARQARRGSSTTTSTPSGSRRTAGTCAQPWPNVPWARFVMPRPGAPPGPPSRSSAACPL